MTNIHILPTDKPSSLYKTGNFLLLDSKAMPNNTLETKNQHIYITSDEEIKEGDYFLYDETEIRYKTNGTEYHGRDLCHISGNRRYPVNKSKKIILTTDQDLINDGVQAIDDEFLEWFVKNPSCKWVEIDKNWNYPLDKSWEYKIIIPKEEPKQIKCYCGHTITCDCSPLEEPKQETIEEAAERYADYSNDYVPMSFGDKFNETTKRDFIEGAKWMQERMYSEEDLISFYNFLENHQLRKYGDVWKRITNDPKNKPLNFESVDDQYIIDWFEQFKKK